MSSRYSKPCNLIQSFIYQQYSFHLSQLCVRMCRQISQLIARGEGKEGLCHHQEILLGRTDSCCWFFKNLPKNPFCAGMQRICAKTLIFWWELVLTPAQSPPPPASPSLQRVNSHNKKHPEHNCVSGICGKESPPQQINPPDFSCLHRPAENLIKPKSRWFWVPAAPFTSLKGQTPHRSLLLPEPEGSLGGKGKRKFTVTLFSKFCNSVVSRREMNDDIYGLLMKMQRDRAKTHSKMLWNNSPIWDSICCHCCLWDNVFESMHMN